MKTINILDFFIDWKIIPNNTTTYAYIWFNTNKGEKNGN